MVEGPDDTRFFNTIVKPELAGAFDDIRVIEYATKTREYRRNLIRSAVSMGASHFVVGDFDSAPCISDRKEKLLQRCPGASEEQAVVVIEEIESWYLAGLDASACGEMQLPHRPVTNSVTKEQFNEMIPAAFRPRIDFLQEILKRYSVETALRQNHSFSYFWNRHVVSRRERDSSG